MRKIKEQDNEFTADEMAKIIEDAIISGNIKPPEPAILFKDEICLPVSGEKLTPETLSAVVNSLVSNDDVFKPLMMYHLLLRKAYYNDSTANEILNIMRPTPAKPLTDEEMEMLDYALGQLDDEYIDLGSGHGDSFEAETTKLVQRILTEYKNTLTGGN